MKYVVLCFLLFACSVTYGGMIVADAVSEFSSVQGKNNWYYGYYDGDVASGGYSNNPSDDDFELMTHYSYISTYEKDAWTVNYASGGYWTTITGGVMVPNGFSNNSGRLMELQWVVRRYVSEVAGSVNISGLLKKYYGNNAGLGGDGVRGYLLVNGNELWRGIIGGSDTIGVYYSVNTVVAVGDLIDFAVDPGVANKEAYDHAYFSGTITAIPEPITCAILLTGGAIVLRRNNRA